MAVKMKFNIIKCWCISNSSTASVVHGFVQETKKGDISEPETIWVAHMEI